MVDMPKETNSTGLYEAAIGEKNQAYYLDRFEQFDKDGAGFHASWNWAALFGAGGVWALYRKMYGWFFTTWAFGIILNMVMKLNPPPVVGLLYLAPWFCFAIFGNSLYHQKVKAQIASAKKSNADERKVIRRLNTSGGVHTWVLYVVGAIPVIGIVAAIAIPAYENTAKAKFDASTAKQPQEEQWGKNDKPAPVETDWAKGAITPPPQVTKETVDWSKFEPIKSVPEKPLSDDDKNEVALALINQREYASALKILTPLAEQGNARAQSSLGAMYGHGDGVAQDFAEAVKWYRLAAQQGNSTSQSNLAAMYGTGDGIEKNYLRAHMWFNLAAISGNQEAVKGRNLTAKLLTPEGIAQAQQMARECQQRNFKGC